MSTELDPEALWDRVLDALRVIPEQERTPPPGARVGAVLVLLEDARDGPRLVLTRRRRDLRSHPGQISFPGGRLDPDETIEEAALREAEEEIGLRASSVDVVGTGRTFYIPPSRFWVVPVLARWREPHPLAVNPWEVDEVIQVPLAALLDRSRWRHAPRSLDGSSWAWQLDDDLLWGATAMVVAVLLDSAVPGWSAGLEPHELGPERAVRPWEDAPSWRRRARLDGELPAVDQSSVPHVTAAQTRAVRTWLAQHGVGPLALAEQAGRALAHAVRRARSEGLADASVTVLAGPSSNGAGGLVAARLLAAAGARVDVLTVGTPRFPEQTHVLRASGVPVTAVDPDGLSDAHAPGEVVIDAVLGVGAEPPLRDLPDVAARWLQRHDVFVVALDLPSGLQADVGLRGVSMTADVTVTLGLPKVGMGDRIAHAYLGDLYLADLGIPRAAWEGADVQPPPERGLFARGPLVRLTADDHGTDAGTPDQVDASH